MLTVLFFRICLAFELNLYSELSEWIVKLDFQGDLFTESRMAVFQAAADRCVSFRRAIVAYHKAFNIVYRGRRFAS